KSKISDLRSQICLSFVRSLRSEISDLRSQRVTEAPSLPSNTYLLPSQRGARQQSPRQPATGPGPCRPLKIFQERWSSCLHRQQRCRVGRLPPQVPPGGLLSPGQESPSRAGSSAKAKSFRCPESPAEQVV